MQMPYDEPAYFVQPSRDPREYDMAAALDITALSYAQRYAADQYEGFAPTLAPSMLQLDPFYSNASIASSFSSSMLHDSFAEPELCHPVPRRPVSPGMFAHDADAWRARQPSVVFSDASAGRSSFSDFSDDSRSSFSADSFHQPSMFAPLPAEGSSAAQAMQVDAEPPQPPPSWAMSGSLDPATGIYQTAPEHPRVRTQQACEKCRGRKAKCSGERPCQRCVNRGLQCEYAPERKMRGPNKVKRKGASNERSSRRTSVISLASTGSEDDASPPPLPAGTEPRQFTMKLDGLHLADDHASGSGTPSATPSPRSERMQPSPPREQHRPPPIDLAGTSLYDQAPVPLPHEVPPFGFDAQSRRASLPAYLLNQQLRRAGAAGRMSLDQSIYSPPRGLDVVETTPRPRSSPAFPLEGLTPGLALFPTSHSSGSSSGASHSTPITPLGAAFDGDLTYPVDDFPAAHPTGFTPDFSSFTRFDGAAGWLGADADATPTLGSGGDAKGFSPFVHDQFISEPPK